MALHAYMLPNYIRRNNIKQRKKKKLKDQSKHLAKMNKTVKTHSHCSQYLLKAFHFSRAPKGHAIIDVLASKVFNFRKNGF